MILLESSMKKIFCYSLLSCLVIFALTGYAQQQPLVSFQSDSASFQSFVNELERQTDYHFYFDKRYTDSIQVMLDVRQVPLKEALDKVLQETELHYNIYNQSIFITHDRQILTELPVGFLNEPQRGENKVDFDFSDFEEQEQRKRQAEEKLYTVGKRTTNMQGTVHLTGVLRDSKNGEPLIGAAVFVENPMIGVATDQFGTYSISLPKGRHIIKIKSVGMKPTHRYVMLYDNGKLDIDVEEDITPLKEVVVESDRDVRVTSMQMGVEKLDIKTMKNMPQVLGETDVMKIVLTLPGVQSVGEGTSGLNVRGGATNQNLILYNDATVYNPSHLFGFFSTFNPNVLKNVELYKSGIAAEYGGRLSSVMDVRAREGNLKKFTTTGGISPVTARLTFEGPIIKEQTSFLLAFRSTYSNWILRQLDSKELQNSTAAFYDINASINHKLNRNNQIYFSAYGSQDKFSLNSDTLYRYSDKNASLKWTHAFSEKLFSVVTGSMSDYSYEVSSESNPVEASRLDFSIGQWNIKADFNYQLSTKQNVTAGLSVTKYSLAPGNYQPIGEASTIVPDELQQEKGLETAIYLGDNIEITPRLSVYAGIRYSVYKALGERDVFLYEEGTAKRASTIRDTVHFGKGQTVASYHGAEPRFSVRYSISDNASVKLSYNRMRQYIQMLSNTTAIAPTDIWKLSDGYVKPQIGDQYAIGFYKNIRHNTIETSVEAYYKDIQNATDFIDGAELLLNHHIETDVLPAKGKAYGIELMFKKSMGKLNGWVSYTYSRSLLQVSGPSAIETVNRGEHYASSYDKPHAVNFIGNYKFNRRFNFSLNTTYSTGRPITEPVAVYELGGSQRILFEDRNASRIPDYFRVDISINVEGNHKVQKLAHSSWTFAIYNLTGRDNAYSVFFRSEEGKINGYKLSVFAKPIPTITYNFKF